MCDICQKMICPVSCPGYRGVSRPRRCAVCGIPLEDGEVRYLQFGNPYCPSCLENSTLDDLVRICESSHRALLEQLGFRRVAPGEGGERWR